MRAIRHALLIPLVLTLAACSGGTGPTQPGNDRLIFGAIAARVLPRGAAPAEPDARAVLTPALVARSSTPLILLVIRETNRGLTMVPRAANLGTEQWRDGNGGGLFRRGGILVGTRGFGSDLHTADVAPLAAALRRGGGEGVERINRYIDGENQIVAVQFLCSVRATGRERLVRYGTAVNTTVYDESCIGEGPSFTNRYWVDSGGTVRRSVELVTPQSGTVEIDLLKS